jgi:hypothetical protein
MTELFQTNDIQIATHLLTDISDSNNNSIEKSAQKVMSNTSGSESLSSPEEDGYEEDECDHRSAGDNPKRDELRKQFCDVLNWTSPSALSTCSMSSSSVCCSPASTRMSSPSPTCMTPTGGLCSANGQHSPSTLSSIREAVSHLTRLDDFNVIKLSHGFFSQVFKVSKYLPVIYLLYIFHVIFVVKSI